MKTRYTLHRNPDDTHEILSNRQPDVVATCSTQELCRRALGHDDLLNACRALLADAPCSDLLDHDDCECGTFDETGTCCHVQARGAIACAEGR